MGSTAIVAGLDCAPTATTIFLGSRTACVDLQVTSRSPLKIWVIEKMRRKTRVESLCGVVVLVRT